MIDDCPLQYDCFSLSIKVANIKMFETDLR